MATITLEIPDDLAEQLPRLGEQLPALLRLCLQPLALPATVYRHILDFIASQPSPEQLAAFRPTPEMQERLKALLDLSQADQLTPMEQAELDEYERIEHLVVMLKAGHLSSLTNAPGV